MQNKQIYNETIQLKYNVFIYKKNNYISLLNFFTQSEFLLPSSPSSFLFVSSFSFSLAFSF